MKITFNSPLILSFSLLSVCVFIITHYFNLLESWFVLKPYWGNSVRFYFSLFGHVLGHASWQHLMGNLSFILLLGPVVEQKFGFKLLLMMFITTALVTAVIHILFFNTGLLGASGIVFMLIILTSLIDFKNKEIPLTFILVALIFIGQEFLGAFNNDNISHTAHIIGGAIGAYFGFLLAGKSKENKTNPHH